MDAGLSILKEHGAPALTIERLTAKLRLSKGSFYHHFKGMSGFKAALLTHFEAEHTTRYIDAVEREATAPPVAKLALLLDLVLSEYDGPGLEIAMRAWALQDPEVQQVQQRVDQTRIEYLRSVWQVLTGDSEEAAQMGRLLYVILIGAGHVIPPIPPDELRRLYDRILQLAPAIPQDGRRARTGSRPRSGTAR